MNVTQFRGVVSRPTSKFHVQFGYASLRRLLYIKYTFPTSSFIIHQTRGGKKRIKKKPKKTRRVLLVVFRESIDMANTSQQTSRRCQKNKIKLSLQHTHKFLFREGLFFYVCIFAFRYKRDERHNRIIRVEPRVLASSTFSFIRPVQGLDVFLLRKYIYKYMYVWTYIYF